MVAFSHVCQDELGVRIWAHLLPSHALMEMTFLALSVEFSEGQMGSDPGLDKPWKQVHLAGVPGDHTP